MSLLHTGLVAVLTALAVHATPALRAQPGSDSKTQPAYLACAEAGVIDSISDGGPLLLALGYPGDPLLAANVAALQALQQRQPQLRIAVVYAVARDTAQSCCPFFDHLPELYWPCARAALSGADAATLLLNSEQELKKSLVGLFVADSIAPALQRLRREWQGLSVSAGYLRTLQRSYPALREVAAIACPGQATPAAIVDAQASRVLLVWTEGTIEKVIGAGAGYAEGPAQAARLHSPQAAVWNADSALLYIADTRNNRLRVYDWRVDSLYTLLGNGTLAEEPTFKIIGIHGSLGLPQDVLLHGQYLFISAAGALYRCDLKTQVAERWIGAAEWNTALGQGYRPFRPTALFQVSGGYYAYESVSGRFFAFDAEVPMRCTPLALPEQGHAICTDITATATPERLLLYTSCSGWHRMRLPSGKCEELRVAPDSSAVELATISACRNYMWAASHDGVLLTGTKPVNLKPLALSGLKQLYREHGSLRESFIEMDTLALSDSLVQLHLHWASGSDASLLSEESTLRLISAPEGSALQRDTSGTGYLLTIDLSPNARENELLLEGLLWWRLRPSGEARFTPVTYYMPLRRDESTATDGLLLPGAHLLH